MVVTRSQRALEVLNRCAQAVNLLAYVAWSGEEYRYTAGMLSPEQQDLLIWVIAFVVRGATRMAGPSEGRWEEQEALALTELFDDRFMEDVAPWLPPVFRNVLGRFRTGQRQLGNRSLCLACEMRATNPRGLLLHAGFRYVEGEDTFHVVGSGIVRRMGNSSRR